MTPSMQPPLSNVQSELLKVYATNVPDETLIELKKVLAKFFLDKARQQADETWEQKKYNDAFFESLDA